MKGRILTALVLGAVLVFNLSLAVRAEVGRDEHMYVAGGYLFSQEGLLPYRDFSFVHLPYLLIAEAALFQLTDVYFLAARFLSAVCVAGLAVCIFYLSERFAWSLDWRWRFSIACGSTLLLVGNPLYVFVAGRAWNQGPASLLAMLSYLIFAWKGLGLSRSTHQHLTPTRVFFSGAFLGLAIGTRISYVTLLPAFAAGLLLLNGDVRAPGNAWFKSLFRQGVFFSLGLLAALAPVLYFYQAAPAAFQFNNFQFHELSTAFRVESDYDGPITLAERWEFFWNGVLAQPGNFVLLLGVSYFGLRGIVSGLRKPPHFDAHPVLLLLMMLFALLGSFIASPSWYQYFFAPVPFAVLLTGYGFAKWSSQAKSLEALPPPPVHYAGNHAWNALLFAQLVLMVTFYRYDDYRRITFLLHPEAWRPLMLRQIGIKVSEYIPDGKVLTITPIIPLEGGVRIYPEFITMFVFRIQFLMSPAEMQAASVLAIAEIEAELADDPPDGILVGMELTLEKPLVEYAQALGYQPVPISDTLSLWMPSP